MSETSWAERLPTPYILRPMMHAVLGLSIALVLTQGPQLCSLSPHTIYSRIIEDPRQMAAPVLTLSELHSTSPPELERLDCEAATPDARTPQLLSCGTSCSN